MKYSRQLFFLSALALLFAVGEAGSAPYIGKPVTYRQPDGTELKLKVWGDEFYARTETLDGYTVTYDPKTKTYTYAALSADGNDFVSTGTKVGKADPKALGLEKGLKLNARARGAKAVKRHQAFEAVVKQGERWESVKSASKEYRKFKKELQKQIKAGKKGIAIPLGTILPDSEPSYSEPQMAGGSGTNDPPVSPAPPTFTLTGDVVGLTILVDFSDVPGTVITQQQVDDYCNKPNYEGFGNAGSVYDYLYIQSGSNLRYNNNVTYYVRVPYPKSYYNDTAADSGLCGRLLLNDALDVLIADGYDFSPLTAKAGGNIRACNILFAGADSGVWAKGLWPHRWVLSPKKDVGGGKYIYDYQITNIGTTPTLKIGTFLHENGHMLLGYPDLYSYNGNAANVGYFSLMASGNYGGSGYHPTHIDPHLKLASGWSDIVDLTSSSHQRCTVQVDGNQFYRFVNPTNALEYFMFEVRDNTGWEGPYGGHAGSVNPATGLLVWHFKDNGQNTYSTIFTADNPSCNYATPYEALVLEANPSTTKNPWYDDPTPGNNDAFKSTDKNAISDSTTPALKFWDATGRNTASGADIHSISLDGPTMTFIIGAGDPSGAPQIALSKASIDTTCDLGQNAGPETFAIGNAGGGTLSYTVSTNQTWLSCTPVSGTASNEIDPVTVNFSTAALSAGSYTATITVNDPAASPTTETITVNLTVNAQPVMALSTTNVTEFGLAGVGVVQGSFAINNTGGGLLNYTVSSTQSWVTLSPASGSIVAETDTIYVDMDSTSLAPGTYYDTVTVTSTEVPATNSPQTVAVEFIVQSTDMVVIYPDGGEKFSGASSETITWSSSLGGNVRIDLLKGGLINDTIDAFTPNDGSYDWNVPVGVGGTDFRVQITSIEQPGKSDDSNSDFTIATNMSFETDWEGWIQDNTDNFDWARNSGTTPSGSTGPSAAYDGTYYVYTEASSPNFPTNTAIIYKDFDFSNVNQPQFDFYYNMYGLAMGTLNFEVSTNSGSTWATAWSMTGDQGTAWQAASVDLSVYGKMANVRLRFRGVTGTDFTGDMAVDCISITDAATDGVEFSSTSFIVGESSGVATVTVNRAGSSVGAISVDYATSDGTATNLGDYATTSGTLSWLDANADPKTFTVTIIGDTNKEDFTETVVLTLSNPSGTTILGSNPGSLIIQDDDNRAPDVYAGPDQFVSLDAGQAGGEPVPGEDFYLNAGLDTDGDSEWEDLTVGNPTGQALLLDTAPAVNRVAVTSATTLTHAYDFPGGSINNDGGALLVASGTATTESFQNSDNGDWSTLPLTIEMWVRPDILTSASANGQILFEDGGGTGIGLFIDNGEVVAGHDSNTGLISYNLATDPSGLLTGNSTSEFFQVVLTHDTVSPFTTKLYVNGVFVGTSTDDNDWSGGDAAAFGTKGGSNVGGRGSGQASAESFDGQIALIRMYRSEILNADQVMSNYNSVAGAGVTVNLDGTVSDPDGDPFTTTWSLFDGPAAINISDPSVVDTTAVFYAEGVYKLHLTADDSIDQAFDEVIITVGAALAGVYVTETAGSTTVEEGGLTDSYSVKLTSAPTNDVTLNLSTNGQVSVNPPSLTFTAGDWSNAQTVVVTAIDDAVNEGAHTGTVSHAVVSADADYNGISVNDVTVSISDNDAPGNVGIEFASYSVSEDGGSVSLNVKRTDGSVGAFSVDILTSDGTALAGTDYEGKSQTLTWPDGNATNKTFVVGITNNATYAGDRSFSVRLENKSGLCGFLTTNATVTILEDDPEPIGARVISQVPLAGVAQSQGLGQLKLTFSEAIDTASFSEVDDIIAFTGGQGADMLGTITGHSWANGDTELTITFQPLNENASYRLVIGPEILTTTGFPMDQDNDSNLGEDPEDTYAANILIQSALPNVPLWTDLATTDDTPDPDWTLGTPDWEFGVPAEDGLTGPTNGTDSGTNILAQNLAGDYTVGGTSYSDTPDINASDYSSVRLDYWQWTGRAGKDELYVDIVTPGFTNRIYTNKANQAANDEAWIPQSYDISAYVTGQVFNVRFGLVDDTGGSKPVGTGWQLDAINVVGDRAATPPPAPVVLSHSPSGTNVGVVSWMYLAFSQPMDTNSFAIGSDISSFTGPSTSITASAFSWISDSLLRIDYPGQSADGTYTLVLNPSVLDGWGKSLDQDKDGTAAEAVQDQYSASFYINNADFIPAPTGLAAVAVSTSQVDVSWFDNSANETGFGLERSTNSGAGFSMLSSLVADATNYSDNAVTPGLTYYYRVSATNATNSSAVSAEAFAAVPKASATVTLGNLSHTYDGNSKTATVTTAPVGLAVDVAYNGGAALPTNAGSYSVVATVNEVSYEGSTNGTLVVSPAGATVTLGNLSQTYDGNSKTATVTTAPIGLTVDVTYDGSGTPPINAGTYAVTGTVNEVNYDGMTNGSLTVLKATPTVTNWPTASDISDGQAVSNSVLTGGSASAPGNFVFDSPTFIPPGGIYTAAVSFVATDTLNYNTVSGGTAEIAVKMQATVTLGNLSQTYDGNAKTTTVTTVPLGLGVDVTYDGAAALPTNAGNYAVIATVNDIAYVGSTNGTLSVAKAASSVTLWPTASSIVIGQAVSNSVLSGGSSTPAGTFSFDAPAITPPVGVHTAAVTFLPGDPVNYTTVAGAVNISVLPVAPAAPTGLAATPSVGQVDLTWNSSVGATSYNVKRSTTSGSGYSTVGTTAATSYTDSTVSNGVTYYYVVSAVNVGGESPDSTEVSAALLHVLPFAEDFEALTLGDLDGQNGWSASNAVVQTNQAIDVQAGSVTSETGFAQHEFAGTETNVWTDLMLQPVFFETVPVVPDPESTVVMYFNTNGNPVVYDGTNAAVLTEVAITTGQWVRLSMQIDYTSQLWDFYVNGSVVTQGIAFYNSATTNFTKFTVTGAGADSVALDDVSIGTQSPLGNLYIPAPSGLGASPVSGWQVDLNWTDNSTNETGFALERSATSGSNFAAVAILAADTTNYSDGACSPGQTYYYRIMATNSIANSAFSGEASIMTPLEYRTLVVTSAHGTASPAEVTTNLWNTVVTASITDSPVDFGGATQYVCTGWIGTGNATNGTGTNTSFTITTGTTITWQWQTNYWVDFNTIGN